jgi:hypothetical protein
MPLTLLRKPRSVWCRTALAATLVLPALSTGAWARTGATSKPAEPTITQTRRLTESEYRNSIADIFGQDIVVNGRFEPEHREQGLLAIGASMLSISASGFEQYYAIAKRIADQATDDKHRDHFVTCKPANAKAHDDACSAQFVRTYGRLLFRHPLSPQEIAMRVKLAAAGADQAQDFNAGLKLALTSLLTAPQFLFRMETLEPDPAQKGAVRLDGYSRATRLSYMLWDSTPDETLLSAAASGELQTEAGVAQQVDRMLASPGLEAGVRAFFSDMLEFDLIDTVTKDAQIYPKFSQDVAASAKEETLRMLVNELLVKNSPYLDIFTTHTTYINRALASVYQVPFLSTDPWTQYTFADDSDRSGILTDFSFLGVFSHPGRSSPTKRGAALREVFLCEPTPQPPANVDFSIVNDTKNPSLKTVRARLLAHAEDDTCAGCHNKTDPIGLSLERFDSLGVHRTSENGDVIDVSAALDGKKFEGTQGLGSLLHANPKVPACLVRDLYAYGVGHAPTNADKAYLQTQTDAFISDNYGVKALLRRIVVSPAFYAPAAPAEQSAPVPSSPAAKPAVTANNLNPESRQRSSNR